MRRPKGHDLPQRASSNGPLLGRAAKQWRALLNAAIAITLVVCAGSVQMAAIGAQDDADAASRESRIKAAYLYQFGRYIQWPTTAFLNAQSPFAIGVVGKDPIVAHLDEIAADKKIQARPIEIRRFSSPKDVRACHILFLPASLRRGTRRRLSVAWRITARY